MKSVCGRVQSMRLPHPRVGPFGARRSVVEASNRLPHPRVGPLGVPIVSAETWSVGSGAASDCGATKKADTMAAGAMNLMKVLYMAESLLCVREEGVVCGCLVEFFGLVVQGEPLRSRKYAAMQGDSVASRGSTRVPDDGAGATPHVVRKKRPASAIGADAGLRRGGRRSGLSSAWRGVRCSWPAMPARAGVVRVTGTCPCGSRSPGHKRCAARGVAR